MGQRARAVSEQTAHTPKQFDTVRSSQLAPCDASPITRLTFPMRHCVALLLLCWLVNI